ncbi:MAG: hypothetical protein MZV70_19905 [Desulfobacterales bacterium]|nr:hypothetical protein [Desulfobacterales bacterium]
MPERHGHRTHGSHGDGDPFPARAANKKAKKIISRFSFELKGGGWYADGYASRRSIRKLL